MPKSHIGVILTPIDYCYEMTIIAIMIATMIATMVTTMIVTYGKAK